MATISEVAELAGVSMSTVSYTLSGQRNVSPETRARVEQAIRDLGYRPNAGARALASSRTDAIALFVPFRPSADLAIITGFVSGIAQAAGLAGKDVLLVTGDDHREVDRVAGSSMADAMIVMDIRTLDPRLPSLRRLNEPVVLIGIPGDVSGLTCVDFDFDAAGRLAAAHLVELGHREIALVGASQDRLDERANYAVRMRAGFLEGASELGVDAVTLPCHPSLGGGEAVAARLVRDHPGCTGVMVHNEAALTGFLTGLAADGRSIPGDVSVMALAPESMVPRIPEPLTSITLPSAAIGAAAVEMVIERLLGDVSHEVRLLPPVLSAGPSTAPPRR